MAITKTQLSFIPAILLCLFFTSCEKLSKTDEVTGNKIPYYDEVPTIKVEAYLNRMYIDLVGREPLDSEVVADIAYLRANDLSLAARETIAHRLQWDSLPRAGEGSYHAAYCHWFIERMKADLIEGANDVDFETEKQGFPLGSIGRYKIERIQFAEPSFTSGQITFNTLVVYMLDNAVYDKINMQTFNFVNATFDNLFFRYPSKNELEIAMSVIDNNQVGFLFDKSMQNKDEYINAIVQCREFYQGMIQRGYVKIMRNSKPFTAEVAKATNALFTSGDYPKFERSLIITDEYAQFTPTYR
ncbi:MAG: hypothetical protein V4616_03230 [Bacteroidota bacterium]